MRRNRLVGFFWYKGESPYFIIEMKRRAAPHSIKIKFFFHKPRLSWHVQAMCLFTGCSADPELCKFVLGSTYPKGSYTPSGFEPIWFIQRVHTCEFETFWDTSPDASFWRYFRGYPRPRHIIVLGSESNCSIYKCRLALGRCKATFTGPPSAPKCCS